VLAAHPERHAPRARLHGQAPHQGHHRRRRGGGRRHAGGDGSLPGRVAPQPAATRRLARASASAFTSSSPTPRRRPSRWRRPSSRRTSRCSGRSASCAR
jgi:hypothetical protein